MKLLIVEDSSTTLSHLSKRTERGGVFTPVSAASYADLQMILSEDDDFFAAVVDLMLPDCGDGEAVKLTLDYGIPTIVLTGSYDQELRSRMLKMPIVDFLYKISADDINSAISLAEDLVAFKGKKVLVLDESPTKRKYISMFFKDLLFDVYEAVDSEEALSLLKASEDIKIITINNERDEIQGPELIKHVRQNPEIRKNMHNQGVVIFGVSSNATEILRSRYIKSGANDLLAIPLNKEEFNAKVINNFNMLRMVEELEEKNKQLEETVKILEEYNKAVDAGGIVTKSDLYGDITYANQAFCRLTGYELSELMGKPHSLFRHPGTPKSVFKEMWETIQGGKVWKGIVKNLDRNKKSFYINATIVPIMDKDGKIIEYVATRQDVTELIKSRNELKKQFQTDLLTSLGNRQKLINDIDSVRFPKLCVFDIDRFKEINSFYGLEAGDKVLKFLGDSVFAFFPNPDFFTYRLGGNEFAALCVNPEVSFSEFSRRVREFAEKTLTATGCDKEIDINLTTAIADGKENLLNRADLALKHAKKAGISFFVYSDETIKETEEFKNNILWTKVIRSAIANKQITPFYQPIINNTTGTIDKYEALIRLTINNNVISPFHFLDIAKRTKYYGHLTRAMVEATFKTFSNNLLKFSLNLSVEDIVNPETMEYIDEMVTAYGVGSRLTFEIVESEGIESFDTVENFIVMMKRKGCSVAIDDFGTGYSNFEHLMRLNADYIKLDGSIIKGLKDGGKASSITEAIVNFAEINNMKTVAEFVGDEETYRIVRDMGITYSQGFHFGKPEPWHNRRKDPFKV